MRLTSLFLLIANTIFAIDLIQIDVGNSINFDGILKMPANEVIIKNMHGTHMALALADELKIQRSKQVVAKQLYWDYYGNTRGSMVKALVESLKEKPQVLSLSYGGSYRDPIEEALLNFHASDDVVIVAAAGNEGGGREYYPANYNNRCILSVGTLQNGKKTSYSNHADVYLEYNKMDPTGTSASTARMAGIVLQLRRNHPDFKCNKIVLTAKMLYGKLYP